MPEVVKSGALLQEKVSNDEVKAQRQARREAEKAKKKAAQTPVVHSKKKPAAAKQPKASVPSTPTPPVVLAVDRRRYIFTPLESSTFDTEHPLVGSVVHTEVPFSAVDPTQPEVSAKERFALVLGVGENELLIRGIYSKETPSRQLFGAWRRLGLDHVSYIDQDRLMISSLSSSYAKVGYLTDEEWNSLF